MKFILLLATISATAFAATQENGENGWFVPQADGNLQWVDKADAQAELARMARMEGRMSLSPVTFYLYTQSNPTEPQEITAKSSSIAASNFNAQNPTRVVIHGWRSSVKDFINEGIRDAWLSRGDFNVIFVDWGRARSIEYASSVVAVPGVGEKVGNLINFLRKNSGLSLDNTMIIGHSLGAHVAGFAGKNVKNGQVNTIVGLDPALPLFSYSDSKSRLNSNDAKYVETIQTNGGHLGFLKPIGKGAFYPNGGETQPGCGMDLTGSCSHSRSVIYYAEAVTMNNFPSMVCEDYERAVSKKCGATYSSVRMGAFTNAYMVDGTFYVPVKSNEPFGQA